MSGEGAPKITVNGAGLNVAIVASLWHTVVMDGLIEGAQRALTNAGAAFDLYRVPGSFELPLAAKVAAESRYDAVVALGVIIRGGTPHFEYVCAAATNGLMQVGLDTEVPIGFGLLTCDSDEQAIDRAGLPGSREDKGAEAVEAALASVAIIRAISKG
jgi:6,7-dimethyl-8-ribityllumazine synthase